MRQIPQWTGLCVLTILAIQQVSAGYDGNGQSMTAAWSSGGPWAGQRPYAPPPRPAGWIDPEPSRWPWNGERDPYADPDGDAVATVVCGGDYVCVPDDVSSAVEWAARHGPLWRTRLASGLQPIADAARERCPDTPVDVTAPSLEERRLACAGARQAVELLGRCEISPRRPVDVRISDEVRHPLGGEIFGLFDPKLERVLVVRYGNIPALVRDTPYAELPQREFYESLIVHEVVHGVLHQRYERKPISHAVYEYPAYALQIESLSLGVREAFLRGIDRTAGGSDFVLSDPVLFFDPYSFAASAHKHFNTSPNGCANIHALLKGEAAFIPATLP
jgi:hypothetical protein